MLYLGTFVIAMRLLIYGNTVARQGDFFADNLQEHLYSSSNQRAMTHEYYRNALTCLIVRQ